MDEKQTPEQQDQAARAVVTEREVPETALESVAGGFLDNLDAKCAIGGGLNLLSSNVALEL